MLAVSSEISDSDGVAIGFVKGIDWDAVFIPGFAAKKHGLVMLGL